MKRKTNRGVRNAGEVLGLGALFAWVAAVCMAVSHS